MGSNPTQGSSVFFLTDCLDCSHFHCYTHHDVGTMRLFYIQLASFPDFPLVAYIHVVLTFKLSPVLFARASLKVNTIYATRGESGNEASLQPL